MDEKKHQSPEYEHILNKYWNNGTAQIQDPYSFIDDIRNTLLEHDVQKDTVTNKDANDYLESISPGNRA
jgi:hypothetical protein